MRVGLVACVAGKLSHPAPAKDLYTSPWFKKARVYAECTCDTWWILSAKHGLVHPDTVVEPYEMTLNAMPAKARVDWGVRVTEAIIDAVPVNALIVILAGQRYRSELLFYNHIDVPMKGLGIGQQLHWLKEHTP